MIDTVVIATDGSESVERAVRTSLDIAARFDAAVHALYVVESDEIQAAPETLREDIATSLNERAQRSLAQLSENSDIPVKTAIRTGRPEREIIEYARTHDADIVAVGTRGRHGEHRLLLGSVAEAVVRQCPVPVLTVRQLSQNEVSADS